MELLAAYILLGIFTGLLSGLLGLGGGVIIVPSLVTIFKLQHFSHQHIMQLATSTSLGTMIFTTLVTAWSHHRRGAVNWGLLRTFIPGLIIGVFVGVGLNHYLSTTELKLVFGFFLVYIAIDIFRYKNSAKVKKRTIPKFLLYFLSLCIGIVAGLLGVGGGLLMIPLFLRLGLPMPQASATSAACAFPVACIGTCLAIIAGWHNIHLPPLTWGYVYWPVALTVGIISLFFAPFGVKLAHYLPVKILKRIFALFLLIVAWQMLR